ncbi:uncharacterized protein si:ch1073-15f19.2 [Synchiropus splendidus]|uniref:uncharacterized protein si:ch1073-15f19.2 n=1 Tax=Synchiropus splendidus TaxID=270530 RepID=UPI00237DF840|nr:uncharacterized protein si:ch1073-15f19.2 [Synchiropus splendidus]
MAGASLGAAFSLLLLASMTHGLQHFSMEETEGQNVSLRCTLGNVTDLKVVNMEWSKRENQSQKLALFAPLYGFNYFSSGVRLQVVYGEAEQVRGSRLLLPSVKVRDSGLYVCDLTTFPAGSIRVETELRVKELTVWSSTADDIITPPTDAPARWTTSGGTHHTVITTTEHRDWHDSTPGAVSLTAATDERVTLRDSSSDGVDVLGSVSTAGAQGNTSISAGSGPTLGPAASHTEPQTDGAAPADLKTPSSPSVKTKEEGAAHSHWLLVLVLLPVLALMAVAGLICRRRVLMKRLEQPPPPPVKYTAVRPESVQWQSFPVSKCNSIQGPV